MNRRQSTDNTPPEPMTSCQVGILSFVTGAMMVMVLDILWRAI